MRHVLSAVAPLLGVLVLSGCGGVVTLSPVYTEALAYADPGLAGSWKLEGEEVFVALTETHPGIWAVELSGKGDDRKEERLHYAGRLFKLDDKVFMDCTIGEDAAGCNLKGLPSEYDGFVLCAHYPVRLERNGDTLEASSLSAEWVAEQTRSAAPAVHAVPFPGKDKWWIVTDDTEKLHALIRSSTSVEGAWDGPAKLLRQTPEKEEKIQ